MRPPRPLHKRRRDAGRFSATPLYPLFIADAGNNGHITECEFEELPDLHKLVEKAKRT